MNFTLGSQWGVAGAEVGEGLGVDGKGQLRSEFVPLKTRFNENTGEMEPYYPHWRRLAKVK